MRCCIAQRSCPEATHACVATCACVLVGVRGCVRACVHSPARSGVGATPAADSQRRIGAAQDALIDAAASTDVGDGGLVRSSVGNASVPSNPSGIPSHDALIDSAIGAMRRSSPGSGPRVGAALLARSGKVYTASALGSASGTVTGVSMCAERAAVLQAWAEGDRHLEVSAKTTTAVHLVEALGTTNTSSRVAGTVRSRRCSRSVLAPMRQLQESPPGQRGRCRCAFASGVHGASSYAGGP